ncbi:MAG TPA: MaoC family dehydratase N-terminal domain-containing protein, partial [Mycobacteriales bacterium]|nr:MaoC family dehydratase N-terminal domain-containing protein [Mycobacteriales bacterium]
FAVAIGADDPVYLDPEAARAAGHPDVIAPPTFPIVLCQWGIETLIGDPGLGLDFDRVVHGEQRFRYVRPLHAGERVTRTTTIEEITFRVGNHFLNTRTDMVADDGELVVTAWLMFVVRGE